MAKKDKKGKKGGSKKRDDFSSMIVDFFASINWKVAILLFVFGFFILSDSFVDILANLDSGFVYGDVTTSKGTLMQLMFIVMGYITIDLVVKTEVI